MAACGSQERATPTPSSPTPPASQTPLPVESVTPTATLAATAPSGGTAPEGGKLLDPDTAPTPVVPMPADIIDGGVIQDGPFIFYLWLFRDPMFNPNPDISSLYSELDGIAVYISWVYQGNDLEGPVNISWGTLPFLHQFGMDAALSAVAWGGGAIGIRLPGGALKPGESLPSDPVQVGMKLETPQKGYEAMISFRLQEGAAGFEPGDIAVELLPPKIVPKP